MIVVTTNFSNFIQSKAVCLHNSNRWCKVTCKILREAQIYGHLNMKLALSLYEMNKCSLLIHNKMKILRYEMAVLK